MFFQTWYKWQPYIGHWKTAIKRWGHCACFCPVCRQSSEFFFLVTQKKFKLEQPWKIHYHVAKRSSKTNTILPGKSNVIIALKTIWTTKGTFVTYLSEEQNVLIIVTMLCFFRGILLIVGQASLSTLHWNHESLHPLDKVKTVHIKMWTSFHS